MAPKRDLRVVLVLELTHASSTSEDQPWGVTASIGGRESTFSVRWGRPGHYLSPSEAEDLLAWVYNRIENTILTTEGLQGELL